MTLADFKLDATDLGACAGEINHRARRYSTPAFMPAGTLGSVKGAATSMNCGFISAFRLYLVIHTICISARCNGRILERGWRLQVQIDGEAWPLGDSGGFQVFRNLASTVSFSEEGAYSFVKKWANGTSYVDHCYSRAYLRHLFISQELLAMQIASIHNLAFYLWLTGEARRHIIAGDFKAWKTDMVERVTRRL